MGNTYYVDEAGLQANMESIILEPQTPELLVKAERIVQNHVWRQWSTSSSADVTTAVNDGATADIWLTWNTSSATTTTNKVVLNIADTDVWSGWNIQTTGGTDPTWADWVSNPNNTRLLSSQHNQGWPRETEEQREARVQRELQRRQEMEARRVQQTRELEAARVEASALLDSLLSEMQRQSLEEEGWFLVIGKSGKIYRLRKGRVGNIDELDLEGNVVKTLCSHPGPQLPNADDLVAQKLFLETDDEYVHQNANVRRPYSDGKVIDITKYLPKVA